jgi:hypothetical protein
MTSAQLNGVIAVLSAMLLAGGCSPEAEDDPKTAEVEQSIENPRPTAPLSCFGVVCAPPNQCQTSVRCNWLTRRCSYTANPVGTACDDGNPSTGHDTCAAGICAGIVLPVDDPSTPGDDRAGWVTCVYGSACQDRCCRVSGPSLPWVCSTGGVCPGNVWGQSSCDGPEDCAQGQVCCPMSDDISCRTSCPVETICHTDRDCTTGQVCSQQVGALGQCAAAPT